MTKHLVKRKLKQKTYRRKWGGKIDIFFFLCERWVESAEVIIIIGGSFWVINNQVDVIKTSDYFRDCAILRAANSARRKEERVKEKKRFCLKTRERARVNVGGETPKNKHSNFLECCIFFLNDSHFLFPELPEIDLSIYKNG